jgi:5'-AMP-activated protein kinase regulatory gamma subunit
LQNLAAEKTYDNLDLTLKEANEHRNEWFEGVYKCQKTDSLYDVMEKIVKAEVSLCRWLKGLFTQSDT